jgi:predicted metal-dependent TIM-barrel fold hydrolase
MRTLLLLAFSSALSFAQLQGIVDVHVHSDPDSVPRKLDALETARQAKDAGMRAVVLKNHWEPTVQLAYTVAKVVPGVEVFGGISLDRAVGGVNPEAVHRAAATAGKKLKIVWMPTFDSENNVTFAKAKTPFVPVAKNGALLPEVVEVIGIIAKEKVVLATGHSSAAEDLLLVREGRKQGVAQIIVTHPLYAPIHMSIPQMKELAAMGAYLELCGNAILPTQAKEGQIPVADYVAAIRAVGPDHMILSGDLGQPANPPYAEAWKQILTILKKAGITDTEIDLMARKNPAKLLGLE